MNRVTHDVIVATHRGDGRVARHFAMQRLDANRSPNGRGSVLPVSELATNAVQHGAPTGPAGHVGARPEMLPVGDGAHRAVGRGLVGVARSTDQRGCDRTAGKTVSAAVERG